MAYYIFDDAFLKEHPGRAEYLLHEDWRLPGEVILQGGWRHSGQGKPLTPSANGEGTTFAIFLDCYLDLRDYENPDEYDGLTILNSAFRVDGLRLPKLARYLAAPNADKRPFELNLIRSQLFPSSSTARSTEEAFLLGLHDNPNQDAVWLVFADWLEEQGRRQAGLELLEEALRRCSQLPVIWLDQNLNSDVFGGADVRTDQKKVEEGAEKIRHSSHAPAKSLARVKEHLAQLCLHTHYHNYLKADLFNHWIFFDDLWAAAHPVLAACLLTYARRWDVLTDDAAA